MEAEGDCWLQITSGQGPAECAWVASRVLELILEEAAALKLRVAVIERTLGPRPGTIDSALLSITGRRGTELVERWGGTILWVGRSPFRPRHKRKNWYVGVRRFEPPARPDWSEKDLAWQTMRGAGPGGQNVNKVETAVRVTHLLTGVCAKAGESRSQAVNRKLALERLSAMLAARRQQQAQGVQKELWMQHHTLERGSPVRVFRGPRFDSAGPSISR